MKTRRGFSIVELLVTLSILGVVVRIAVPRYWEVHTRALSRAAIADVRVVREALLLYNQDKGTFPGESAGGSAPAGLTSYLPNGFTFTRGRYSLDYESWEGQSASGAPDPIVAVAVVSADSSLVRELRKLGASGIPYFVSGTKTVFVLSGLAGIS